MSDPRLRRQFKRKFDEKQNIPTKVPGLLGNGVGIVETGTENRVYVRVNGVSTVAVCESVPHVNELPVWVGYSIYDPSILRILSQRIVTTSDDHQTANGVHAETHRYFGSGVGGGTDTLWVDNRQLLHLKPLATPNILQLTIQPSVVNIGGKPKLIGTLNPNGTITGVVVELVDYMVTTVGKARFVRVDIDTDGDIVTTGGTEVDFTALDWQTDIPARPAGHKYDICAVRMYFGQTQIVVDHRSNPDVLDMRGGVTAESSEVSIAVDDLTDVTVTSLADNEIIGSSSGAWVNKTLAEAGISAVGHIHAGSDITDLDGVLVDMTDAAAGDVVIIHSIPMNKGSNIATLAAGATVAGISVYQTYVANNAIDGDDATYWAGESNPVADDWFKIDFGAVKDLFGWKLYQYPYTGMWGATQYKVQKSTDGTNWTDIVTHTVAADSETVDFATIQSTRYLRFYATAGNAYSWRIYTLEVYEADPVPEITRLPISATDGDVLTVDGGAPVWAAPTGGSDTTIDGITVDLTGITGGQTMVYDSANTKLIAGDAGGGGASAFTDLTDVPQSYTGLGGKFVRVNAGETALETAAIAGGGDVLGPATSTDGHLAVWDGTDSKTLKDGGAPGAGGGADILEVQVFM